MPYNEVDRISLAFQSWPDWLIFC